MNHKPVASIIIPVYNGENFIGHCLQNCLAQTERNIEIIVVDDGSRDGTAEVVKAYLHDERVRYFHQANKERSAARNRGMAESRGTYLQFVDADDWLDADKIELQVQWLDAHPEHFAVYGPTAFHREDRANIQNVFHYLKDNAFSERIWMVNFIPINALLMRASPAYRFDESMRLLEDWKFLVDILRAGHQISACEKGMCHVLLHGENSSSQSNSMREAELKMLDWLAEVLPAHKKHIPRFARMRWALRSSKPQGVLMLLKDLLADAGYRRMVGGLIAAKLRPSGDGLAERGSRYAQVSFRKLVLVQRGPAN